MKTRSVLPVRIAKFGYIALAAVLFAAGIYFIITPHTAGVVLARISGAILIVIGAVKITGYFSKDLYRLAFQYDLQFGAVLCAVGLILILRSENVLDFISVALGVIIFTDSLFRISTAMESRRFGISQWWLILISAIAAAVMGLLLMFRPAAGESAMLTVIGAALIAEAVLMLLMAVFTVKIINHQWTDEVDYIEI